MPIPPHHPFLPESRAFCSYVLVSLENMCPWVSRKLYSLALLKHDIKLVFTGHIKCEMVVNIAITQNTKSFFLLTFLLVYIALLMKNNRKPLYNGDHWPKGEFVHSTEFLQHLPSDAHNDTPTCIHTHINIFSAAVPPHQHPWTPSPVSPLAYNPHPLRIFPLAGGRPKIAHGWLTESQGCTIPVRCTTELSDMKCCIKRNIQWNNIARCYLVK